jgi:hypothetical protein
MSCASDGARRLCRPAISPYLQVARVTPPQSSYSCVQCQPVQQFLASLSTTNFLWRQSPAIEAWNFRNVGRSRSNANAVQLRQASRGLEGNPTCRRPAAARELGQEREEPGPTELPPRGPVGH